MFRKIRNLLLRGVHKVSNFGRGVGLVFAALFGIRQVTSEQFTFAQLHIATIVFLIVTPLGLLFFGSSFSITVCAAIILLGLALVNLDNALMLVCVLSDYGVGDTPQYRAWLNPHEQQII
jgi:hypothetical protein